MFGRLSLTISRGIDHHHRRLFVWFSPWLAPVVAAAVTQLALATAVVAFNAPDTPRLLWCTGSIRTLTLE
jgi:hypothetical protein